MTLVHRDFSAERLNAIVNDPSVHPWVCGAVEGPLDLTPAVADPANVLLMGEHGGVLFMHHQPGLYEAHTQVLPAGRGEWTEAMVRDALHVMFTATDAMEIVTRVPKPNVPALALTKHMGFDLDFTTREGWVIRERVVPASLYSLTVQCWMRGAPGLIEAGRKRLPDADENAARALGAAIEMIDGGQIGKAGMVFNRFAAMTGIQGAMIEAEPGTPPVVNLAGVKVLVPSANKGYATCQ